MKVQSANSPAAALVGVPRVTVALDRGRALSMVFAGAVSIALMLMVVNVDKVVLELVHWASLFILAVLGVIPFWGLAKLAESAVGNGGADMLPHVIDLVGMAVLFFAVVRYALRKLR